jgi:hypothetical protein
VDPLPVRTQFRAWTFFSVQHRTVNAGLYFTSVGSCTKSPFPGFSRFLVYLCHVSEFGFLLIDPDRALSALQRSRFRRQDFPSDNNFDFVDGKALVVVSFRNGNHALLLFVGPNFQKAFERNRE